MTLTIRISSEAESRLRDQASAAGKELADYVAELVERGAVASNGSLSTATAERRRSALDRFVARARQQSGRLPPGYVADDSRESIYKDRGE